LVSELERQGVSRFDMRQQTALEFKKAGVGSPRLLVALGAQAAQAVATTQPKYPVLCTLLPRTSFEAVLREAGQKSSDQFSALYLDQPLGRHLELIRIALPAAKNVGVLWGPESIAKEPFLKALAATKLLSVVDGRITGDNFIFPQLKKVLAEADVLLALADQQVFNAQTIQNILLSSFRARVPLVGFSPAYVRAGALLAVFSTPEQIGRQSAAIAKDVLQGRNLPATPLYPSSFTVLVNDHVARSLGLNLEVSTLTERLKSHENAK
jgi:putative ABC transport system substrate-binding protein